jgi:hypothetical protein
VISKKIDRSRKTSSYERLGRYLVDAKDNDASVMWTRTAEYVVDETPNSDGEKVLWYRITNCSAEVPAMAIAEVEVTQSQNTRSKADKTYHLVISFPEGEAPTREQLEDIEDRMCEALGFAQHQRISAVHQDTDNIHLHLAINKVNPTTFNVLEPYRDYYTRNRVCREMEQKHGLTVDNGIGEGQRFGKANEMDAHSPQETLWRWIDDNAKPALIEAAQTAANWQSLHEKFQAQGLVIKPRGAGLVIGTLDGAAHIKASSVDKALSFKSLTSRLGEYESPPQQTNVATSENQYRPIPKLKTMQNNALYAEYQATKERTWLERRAAKDAQLASRQNFQQELKEWHRQARQKIQSSIMRGPAKKDAYQRLAAERETAYQQFKDKETQQKKALQKDFPLMSWEEYLVQAAERGNRDALEILRSQKQRQSKLAAALLKADDPAKAKHLIQQDLNPVVRKNGELFYRIQDGGTVTDEKTQIRVDNPTAGAAFLALSLAAERFEGQALTIQGTDDFKRQIVEFAVQYRLPVKFKDTQLDEMREKKTQTQAIPDSQGTDPLSTALSAYIDQRNALLNKVADVLPHRLWSTSDAGENVYRGRRHLTDGSEIVLLERKGAMLVKPVGMTEARGLTVGQAIKIEQDGQIEKRGQGYER